MKKYGLSLVFAVLLIAMLACFLVACDNTESEAEYEFSITADCAGVINAGFDSTSHNETNNKDYLIGGKAVNFSIILGEKYSGEDMIVTFNGVPVTMEHTDQLTNNAYTYNFTPTAAVNVVISGVTPQKFTLSLPTLEDMSVCGIKNVKVAGIYRLNNYDGARSVQKDYTEILTDLPTLSELKDYVFYYGDRVMLEFFAEDGKKVTYDYTPSLLDREYNIYLTMSSFQPKTESQLCYVELLSDVNFTVDTSSTVSFSADETFEPVGDVSYFSGFYSQKNNSEEYMLTPTVQNISNFYGKLGNFNELLDVSGIIVKQGTQTITPDAEGWYCFNYNSSAITVSGFAVSSAFVANDYREITLPAISGINYTVSKVTVTSEYFAFSEIGTNEGENCFLYKDPNGISHYYIKKDISNAWDVNNNTIFAISFGSATSEAPVFLNDKLLGNVYSNRSLAFSIPEQDFFGTVFFKLDANNDYSIRLCNSNGSDAGVASTYCISAVEAMSNISVSFGTISSKTLELNAYLAVQNTANSEFASSERLTESNSTITQEGDDVVIVSGTTTLKIKDASYSNGSITVNCNSDIYVLLTYSEQYSEVMSGITVAEKDSYYTVSTVSPADPNARENDVLYVSSCMDTAMSNKYGVQKGGRTEVTFKYGKDFTKTLINGIDVYICLFTE